MTLVIKLLAPIFLFFLRNFFFTLQSQISSLYFNFDHWQYYNFWVLMKNLSHEILFVMCQLHISGSSSGISVIARK